VFTRKCLFSANRKKIQKEFLIQGSTAYTMIVLYRQEHYNGTERAFCAMEKLVFKTAASASS